MAIITTLAACNANPALNGPDGASDLPSLYDDAIRYALSFVAQLRDGAGVATGMIAHFAGSVAQIGWIRTNGALLSRTVYANLFAYATAQGLVSEAAWSGGLQGCFSVGDGSTTFRIPDTRGTLLRDLDESRGFDASRVLGSYQADRNAAHVHATSDPTHVHGYSDPSHQHAGSTDAQGGHAHTMFDGSGVGGGTVSPRLVNTAITPGGIAVNTDAVGNHAHNIVTDFRGIGITIAGAATGISIVSSGGDGVGKNYAFPNFIKY